MEADALAKEGRLFDESRGCMGNFVLWAYGSGFIVILLVMAIVAGWCFGRRRKR